MEYPRYWGVIMQEEGGQKGGEKGDWTDIVGKQGVLHEGGDEGGVGWSWALI